MLVQWREVGLWQKNTANRTVAELQFHWCSNGFHVDVDSYRTIGGKQGIPSHIYPFSIRCPARHVLWVIVLLMFVSCIKYSAPCSPKSSAAAESSVSLENPTSSPSYLFIFFCPCVFCFYGSHVSFPAPFRGNHYFWDNVCNVNKWPLSHA